MHERQEFQVIIPGQGLDELELSQIMGGFEDEILVCGCFGGNHNDRGDGCWCFGGNNNGRREAESIKAKDL